MNQGHTPHDDDQALRAALREALPCDDDADALQARVLAQWRQRHPPDGRPVGVGAGLLGLRGHPGRWLGAAALAGGMALALAWCSVRPDPAMEELMQLDVLSQIAIGEM